MYEELLRKLKLELDEPEEKSCQFNFDLYADKIAKKLTDGSIPDNFVIGVDGEWGSGKTTLLKNIKKKLKDNNLEIIYFSAWEYERVGVFASLLDKIKDAVDPDGNCFTKTILSFGIDVLLRRTIYMTKAEVEKHFKNVLKNRKTLRTTLEERIKKRLVILIDDLDRCSVENTFEMLEDIKFFLMMKQITIIIAVDMNKIDDLWMLKYRNKNTKTTGRNYVEKMFKLRIPIPNKTEKDITQYVKKLVETFDDKQMEFFIKILPPNPRKIKLALNQMWLILNMTDLSLIKKNDEHNYLCTLMTWIGIMNTHRDTAQIIQRSPSYLVYAAFMCSKYQHRPAFEKMLKIRRDEYIVDEYDRSLIDNEFMNSSIRNILNAASSSELSLFKILRRYGALFKIKQRGTDPVCISSQYKDDFDRYYCILKRIIDELPM